MNLIDPYGLDDGDCGEMGAGGGISSSCDGFSWYDDGGGGGDGYYEIDAWASGGDNNVDKGDLCAGIPNCVAVDAGPPSDCSLDPLCSAAYSTGQDSLSGIPTQPYTASLWTLPGAGAPNNLAKTCQAKVQAAVNKALGSNATYEGPTAGLNDPTYGRGWRNGAYNFNFFAAGYTGSISPGNCGRFAPGVTGTGGSLHIIIPTGGCNPGGDPYINPTGMVTINGQTGFQFTAHIDSAYAYSPWGAILHFIEDVVMRRAHGC